MIRTGRLAVFILCIALQPAAADEYYREDLRIPMIAAGARGLEAMLLRPAGSKRYPLALLSHGTPRDPAARAPMTPYGSYPQALEFARRGFAALVVMRRGYGDSGGRYAESSGPCGRRDYLLAARESVTDLRAAVEAINRRSDVTTAGMIAVGISAGGFASIALSADPPTGLVAAINFAGGRGSRADNDVCDEDRLVGAFATFGRTSRVPTLWIYSDNDTFFGPDLAQRMYTAFTGAGGRAQFIKAPAFGDDGHFMYSRAIPQWAPMVDAFLREQRLGSREIAALPTPPALPPPPQMRERGRAGFVDYLAGSPHKAFAISPNGAFAYRSARRSAGEATDAALTACADYASECTLYALDDQLAGKAGVGAR